MCSLNNVLEMIGRGISSSFSYVAHGLNSELGIAAVGSFAGAVGGYVIAMVINHRTEVISKVGHTKTAIAVVHSLFNTFLSLKKQHIKELCEQYEKNKNEFIELKKAKNPPREVIIPFVSHSISFPRVDFGLINTKLFEKADVTGRAYVLATTLINCIHELQNQIAYRHEALNQIAQISAEYKLDDHDRACLYYGIRLNNHPTMGNIDFQTYSDVMGHIRDFNNDIIWFSRELVWELIKNGKESAKKLIFSRPKIGSVDYSDVESSLMPDDANYKDWREKFKKA